MTQMTTTRLMKLTEEQAYEMWSNQTFPTLLRDVSRDDVLQQNREGFIEQGDRVNVTLGLRSELSAEERLLAAKKASLLQDGLTTAVVAAPEVKEGRGQTKRLGLFGLFREKLGVGKRKAPELQSGEQHTPKKPKI